MSSFLNPESQVGLIQNIREAQYKMGDLVNWNSPYGLIYMAIIDSIESDATNSTYNIHVIDSAWSDTKIQKNIKETDLKKIDTQPEYNPDLFINITQGEKVKTMLKLKQAIRALKSNINFIESMPPDTFSDFAIGPKIKQLEELKDDLKKLYDTPNMIDENTYISFNNKLYGNLIVQISGICDKFGVDLNSKEKIIEKTIQICNCLISFTGISIGLNIAYYKNYGEILTEELLKILPDNINIKREIIQILYQFLSVILITQFDAFYGACSNIKETLIIIINLFRNQIIQLPNTDNTKIKLPEIKEQTEMIIENKQSSPESSQYSIDSNLSGQYDFEEKCTIGDDVLQFDEEAQAIFNSLNEKLSKINNFDDDDFDTYPKKRQKIGGSKRKTSKKTTKHTKKTTKHTKKTSKRSKKNTKRAKKSNKLTKKQ